MSSKPSVLIIGGLGYLGRWLAWHIHKNELASEVKIVDKQLPQLAWLAPEFKEPTSNFVQADMSREHSAAKVFEREDGSTWDYVFNCGGETRYSQEDEVYKQRTLELAVTAGKEAAKRGVKLFVELSDGRVYKSSRTPSKETEKPHPVLPLAKYKLLAEEELKKIEGLNLVILRLPNVYGPYSTRYFSTVLCNARVYQHLNEPMNWLWTKDLRIHTVHVRDAVRAFWHVAEWYTSGKSGWDSSWGAAPTFNIVDHSDTCYVGSVLSQVAKVNLASLVEDANDVVLTPWANLQKEKGASGPLSPFLEIELLKDNDSTLDGSRFEQVTGFNYETPKVKREVVEEMLESYKRVNWWP